MRLRYRTLTACAAVATAAALLAGALPAAAPTATESSVDESSSAPTPPDAVREAWREFELAGEFTFDTPWRTAWLWQQAARQAALLEIIRLSPDGVDAARAHLELAEQWPDGFDQLHAGEAVRILRELQEVAPETEGLVELTFRFAGSRWMRGFSDPALPEFLTKRSQLGGADAAQAAFRAAQLAEDAESLQRVARSFPGTSWAEFAELESLRYTDQQGFLRALVAYADRHPGTPAAHEALQEATAYEESSSYGYWPDEEDPLPHWITSLRLRIRLATVQPPSPEHRETLRQPDAHYDETPQLNSFARNFGPDLAQLESLSEQLLAIAPPLEAYYLNALADARRIGESDHRRRYDYFVGQWDAAERRVKRATRERFLFARAWFFERWVREFPDEAAPRVRGSCETLLREFPRGQYAAPALDLLALDALYLKDRGRARELWGRLLGDYPEHPLARLVAFDVIDPDSSPEQRRVALRKAAARFPDDPVYASVIPLLIADTYRVEGDFARAIDLYHEAERAWPTFGDRSVMLDVRIGAPSSSGTPITGVFQSWPEIEDRIAGWELFRAGGFADLKAWHLAEQAAATAERQERLAKLVSGWRDSVLAPRALFRSGRIYEKAGDAGRAREQYQRILDEYATRPADVLVARFVLAQLDDGAGTDAVVFEDKSEGPDVTSALRAALMTYQASISTQPAGEHVLVDLADLSRAVMAANHGAVVLPGFQEGDDTGERWRLLQGTFRVREPGGRLELHEVLQVYEGFERTVTLPTAQREALEELCNEGPPKSNHLALACAGLLHHERWPAPGYPHAMFGRSLMIEEVRFLDARHSRAEVDIHWSSQGHTEIYERSAGAWTRIATRGHWIA